MATRKSPQVIREELRVLGEAADDVSGAKEITNWFTPEFWTMAISAVTNLVAVGTVLGWINTSDAESLTKAVTALLGAAQVLAVNTALVWKFITARTAVKEALVYARFRYMEAVAIERMRAEKE